MSISQPTLSTTPKDKRFYCGLGCFAIVLISPILLYYGYCWGLWGRQTVPLQYFFQCSCPDANEEARYPNEVDVIVPACRNAGVKLSPSGRLLYTRERKSGATLAYLLDFQSRQKTGITDGPFTSFLTDELWYVERGLESYIIDSTTGKQYLIERFRYSHRDGEINGNTNLTLLAERLRQADHVFLIENTGTTVALSDDFRTFPDHNFRAERFDVPDFNMERFLQENKVVYQIILPDFPGEAVSPDGRFIARSDGIYLVETGKKIVEGYAASKDIRPYSGKYFMVRGWMYDSSGAIYSKFLNPCLIETTFFIFDDYSCYYEVPQPVIKINVPEEYLSSTPAP